MELLRAFVRPRANRARKNLFGIWHLLSGLLIASGMNLYAQKTSSSEYQIKAVFLFNFAQFVEWPPQTFPETQTPLIIGILGEDPFGAALDETVRGEIVNNRYVVVERYRSVEEIKTCHLLFISRTEAGRLQQIFASLKGRSILTVGEAEGFARLGVMIRFVTVKNKIRLKINLDAAKAANLTISSKLLRPAEIVTSGKD